MFTGIIEELGTVGTFVDGRLTVACTTVASDAAIGDSIAVNGTCLTVVERTDAELSFDVSEETVRRTSLRRLQAGSRVNLERPATLTSRLGGHLVQGHVDGVGEVVEVRPEATGAEIVFAIEPELRRFVVEKGSITLDGVSLTVAALRSESITVAMIPHTLAATTFGSAVEGTPVNVEVDVIAKYVAQNASLLAAMNADAPMEGTR